MTRSHRQTKRKKKRRRKWRVWDSCNKKEESAADESARKSVLNPLSKDRGRRARMSFFGGEQTKNDANKMKDDFLDFFFRLLKTLWGRAREDWQLFFFVVAMTLSCYGVWWVSVEALQEVETWARHLDSSS